MDGSRSRSDGKPAGQRRIIAGHRSLPSPAGPQVVRGAERYTFDTDIEGLLHIKMLRSPHPHAKIVSIDKRAALSLPGVHAVLTFEDVPDRLFSTARHERDWMDPDDTRVLDRVVRFIGQKVAAVAADTEAIAEEACRRLEVEYEILPAVVVPHHRLRVPVLRHHLHLPVGEPRF